MWDGGKGGDNIKALPIVIIVGVGLDGFEVEVTHGNILRNVIVSIVVGNFCCGKMAIYEQAWYMNGQIVFK